MHATATKQRTHTHTRQYVQWLPRRLISMHPIHIYIHVYVCACVPLWAPSKLFVVATRTCAPIARLQQHYYQVLMCILLQPLICFSISISFVFRLSLPLRWFQRFLIKRLLESGSEASMLLPRLRLLLFCIYNNSNGRALWFIYMHPIASLTAAIAHKHTHEHMQEFVCLAANSLEIKYSLYLLCCISSEWTRNNKIQLRIKTAVFLFSNLTAISIPISWPPADFY